jgi:hypothetical protein
MQKPLETIPAAFIFSCEWNIDKALEENPTMA